MNLKLRHGLLGLAFIAAVFYVLPARVTGQLPVPDGLAPGETYHLIFNSSATTTAVSSNIATYNNVAQAAANAAGIGTSEGVTWKAVASTPGVNARDNAPVSGPVYNMNLELVASNFADMWDGTLSASLQWNEFGGENDNDAWTGAEPNGLQAGGLQLGSGGSAWCGNPTQTNSLWINFIAPSVFTPLHVYGLSELLTVPTAASTGDYNGDGTVNAADYTVWRDTLGSTTNLSADGNANNQIDTGDYTHWRARFGQSAASGGGTASAVAVPEPAGVLLLIAAIALLSRGRCSRPPSSHCVATCYEARV